MSGGATTDYAVTQCPNSSLLNLVAAWEKDNQADSRKPPTPGERMRRAAEALRAQADEMNATADAIDPLWGKLDERQKRTLSAYLDQSFAQRR